MKKKNNLKSLDQYTEEQYGKKNSPKRIKFEIGYEDFRLGFILQQARLKKGMTQGELAEKIGSTKSYISKIENDVKEVRISTLMKIVEKGLGGKLNLSVTV
ncbi:MAG: antitoxin HipB [Chlorobi bacterium OLB5]|nr:MAG: antitoxin HipB [Chlorobi bacterium OLB5]